MSDLSRPWVHSSPNLVTMDHGPVKNSGEIFPADQIACQMAIATNTAPPPRTSPSCFW